MSLFLRTNWSAVAVLLGVAAPLGCGSESGTPPAAMGGTTSAAGTLGSGGAQTSGGTGGSGGVTAGGAGAGGATAGTAGTSGSGGVAGGAGGAAGAAGTAGGGAGGAAGASGGGAGGAGGGGGAGGSGGAAAFELLSPAFAHVEACSEQDHAPCEMWPNENLLDTIGGDNVCPALSWGAGPQGTMSYALVLHDYTNTFTHWALWNLSLETTMIMAGMTTPPQGASQVSFVDGEGYAGPGANDHVYEFRLYALNVATFTPTNANDQGAVRQELENDPDNIVLGTTDLRGVTPP